MITVSVRVPFEELMGVIEDFLLEKGLVKQSEYLMYADLGLPVHDDGTVELDLELDNDPEPPLSLAREFPVEEVPKDTKVIDLNDYRQRKQLALPFKEDEDLIDEA